ncbi:MAG: hypothetical protein A07HR60_01791 [uncultured archaeon A07HR60]|jgi:hypothetical protein|nr:MAG: hypothetical protein A07HR60_01791 [uncultured archaeon A07HR60]
MNHRANRIRSRRSEIKYRGVPQQTVEAAPAAREHLIQNSAEFLLHVTEMSDSVVVPQTQPVSRVASPSGVKELMRS